MGDKDGLTVAALKGESVKAGGAVDAEPGKVASRSSQSVETDTGTQQGPASGLEELDADVKAAQDSSAGGEGEEAGAAKLPAEVQAAVDAQVQAAVAAVRREYEEAGGHLSKLRSKKDKEIAKLRKQLEAEEEAKYQEALKLAERRPEEAVQRMAQLVEGGRAQRAREQQEARLQEWADGILEELGLDPEDEAVAEVAARVGPLTSEGASYAYLGEMGKLAKEQEAARRTAVEKELAQLTEGLPGMISAAVAKQLAASGIGAVDGSDVQAPASENKIKNITSPSRLMAMGWKNVQKKG